MATGTHTLLERITVGAAGAASVTFSSIPQTGYTDLKIVFSARSARAANTDDMVIGFNGVNTNLTGRYLWGTGSAAASGTDTQVLIGEYPTANSTASTFSNCEVMIPNYTSANYKSFSADTVNENNATLAYATLAAGLWSSTAAITSITLKTGSGSNLTQYSTFSLYGIAASGTTPTKAPKAVGGDIIQTDGTYWYHAFINTGAFVPATGLTVDYLVVAGGGAAGASNQVASGGGGAGGILTGTSLSVNSGTSYTCTIGGGGATGSSGSNSVFSSFTATGGGKGASRTNAAVVGGSGGGGAADTNATGANGTSGQGNQGGNGTVTNVSTTDYYTAAGGGGGGAAASNSSSKTASSGGIGLFNSVTDAFGAATGTGVLSGGHYYYAGGGGGSVYVDNASKTDGVAGAGGIGGGGTGGARNQGTIYTSGADGTANTGGGGGGNCYLDTSRSGGSGIVIIRYAV